MNTTCRTLFALMALGVGLGTHAQELQTERLEGHELTEVRHAEIRQTLPGDMQSADSLVEVRMLEVRTYIDTIRSIAPREHTVSVEHDSLSRKGHYVEVHAGAGYGSVGYGLLRKELVHPTVSGHEQTGISGVVQLQYAYFFHKNVGIGVGAWLANYTSHGYLGDSIVFNGLKLEDGKYVPDTESGIQDSDKQGKYKGEYYNHHADILSWHERQTIHTIGVPISLQIQAWGKRGKAGFFASVGGAPAYTVMKNYRVLDGKIEHWGAYLHRDAIIHDAYEFGTIDYMKGTFTQNGVAVPYTANDVHLQGNLTTVRQLTVTGFLDLGLLIRMSKHTDLLLGVYGHYTADVVDEEAALIDLGWKDTQQFDNLKVQPYQGILATNCIADKNGKGHLQPWQAGVKIGVHWHSAGKPRTTTVLRNDTALQMVTRYDSIWTTRIDTLQRQMMTPAERVQQQIDKLNRIYFDFDSYQLSDESMQFLDKIAEQLKTIPNKVVLGGHASKEGTRAHNARLAHYRALIVKYYLVDQGIPATRMIVRDYGSDVENAINYHHELSLDRRVEIIVQDE